MSRDKTRDVILSDEQLGLIVEGLEYVRLACRIPSDAEVDSETLRRFIEKEKATERLQARLLRRIQTRRQGHTGNYAEKL